MILPFFDTPKEVLTISSKAFLLIAVKISLQISLIFILFSLFCNKILRFFDRETYKLLSPTAVSYVSALLATVFIKELKKSIAGDYSSCPNEYESCGCIESSTCFCKSYSGELGFK